MNGAECLFVKVAHVLADCIWPVRLAGASHNLAGMSELELRVAVCEAGRRLWQRNLVGATEGNISCRLNSRQLICTPRGVSKGHMKPNDLCVIDMKGSVVRGDNEPSSEIKLHLACYQHRPDCQAVVHAHPITATALTLCGRDIPDNVLPESAVVLGSVAIVPFAMPGTDEVPEAIEPLLADHKTFLLAHHGAFALGKDVYDACHRLETLERIAMTLDAADRMGGYKPMPEPAFDQLLETSLHGRLD